MEEIGQNTTKEEEEMKKNLTKAIKLNLNLRMKRGIEGGNEELREEEGLFIPKRY